MTQSLDPKTAAVKKALEKLGDADGHRVGAALCRSLAHEVKNALNPMNLQLELLRRKTEEQSELLRLVDALRDSVRKLDRIMNIAQGFGHAVAPPGQDDGSMSAGLDALNEAFRPGEPGP